MSLIVRSDAALLPLRPASIDCVVTSPPYNVGMGYVGVDDAVASETYRARVARWTGEITRVLKPGGRELEAALSEDLDAEPTGETVAFRDELIKDLRQRAQT
jgi:site-specific DNA-methyltransferase (adenine-specific)